VGLTLTVSDGFVGREHELARLAELADKVRAGDPQVVCVRGQAGIGKTTMVRRFAAGLPDFTVLVATASAAETGLDFGVLGQLVRRVPEPTPLLADPAASPLAVGARLLDLLGRLQTDGSVAIVVDDIQWADPASVQALGFVLRRIWADHVLVIAVAREEDARLDRLTRSGPTVTTIELTGLGAGDVAQLSRVVVGRELPGAAAERLRDYTGGHPLHLRTLLAEVPAEALTGRRIPVPPSLVTAVRAATERLPAPTRDLLDGLAVLGARGPLARLAQVAGVDAPSEALQPALDAGLAQWWPDEPSSPVGIVHELQREAIYSALSPARRSRLHARAAEVVDRAAAWGHRVAAATTADEPLAAELEAAAAEQAERGQHGAAAEYLRWAADLSPARADEERRLLTSGVQVLFSSDRTRVHDLLPRLEQCAPSALRSLCLGFAALYAAGEWAAAARWFTEALARPDAPRWVRGSAAAGLAGAHTWSGRDREAIAAVREALSVGELPVVLRDYTELLAAVARCRLDGMLAGLAELANLPRNPSEAPVERLDCLACRGAIRTMLGRFTEARRDLVNVVRRQRTGVFLIGGTVPHCYLAAGHYQLGEWDEAAVVMRQATSVDELDEPPQNLVMRRMAATFVPAGRGDWPTAVEHVRAAHQLAQQLGGPQDLRYAAIAEATLAQARADHQRMFAALDRLPGLDGPDGTDDGVHRWWDLWWRPLLVEALLALDRTDAAATQLNGLRVRADGVAYLDSTLVRLTAGHRHATGDLAGALTLTAEFLRQARTVTIPLADALLEHDHGRRLLTAGRVEEATRWLRAAKGRLHRLGAGPFERRVDEHLAMAGVPDRGGDALAGLTDREWEVARLVGRNLTNREIGARLYVTTKTVEYHLGNVYAKLGIASRRELRARLEPKT
jgi:DNA-binding CsgD family transcriptional regulator